MLCQRERDPCVWKRSETQSRAARLLSMKTSGPCRPRSGTEPPRLSLSRACCIFKEFSIVKGCGNEVRGHTVPGRNEPHAGERRSTKTRRESKADFGRGPGGLGRYRGGDAQGAPLPLVLSDLDGSRNPQPQPWHRWARRWERCLWLWAGGTGGLPGTATRPASKHQRRYFGYENKIRAGGEHK